MKSFTVAKVFVVNEAGELLVLRRSQSDVRRPGQWDFPGGWVDDGEDVRAAAIRETHEEAGLDVPNITLAFGLSEPAEAHDGPRSGTWIVFIAHVPGQPTITLSDEHDEYRWMTLETALKEVVYDRQQRMLKYVRDNNLLEQ